MNFDPGKVSNVQKAVRNESPLDDFKNGLNAEFGVCRIGQAVWSKGDLVAGRRIDDRAIRKFDFSGNVKLQADSCLPVPRSRPHLKIKNGLSRVRRRYNADSFVIHTEDSQCIEGFENAGERRFWITHTAWSSGGGIDIGNGCHIQHETTFKQIGSWMKLELFDFELKLNGAEPCCLEFHRKCKFSSCREISNVKSGNVILNRPRSHILRLTGQPQFGRNRDLYLEIGDVERASGCGTGVRPQKRTYNHISLVGLSRPLDNFYGRL